MMMTTEPAQARMQERAKPRWRQLAKSLVPDVYEDTFEKKPSTYAFFRYLRDACREAHEADDSQRLCKIYAFAYWAFDHPSKNLWNPAGVTFFEDLFSDCKSADEVNSIAVWLRKDILEATITLMKFVGYSEKLISEVEAAKVNAKLSRVGDVNRTLQTYLNENGVH